MTERRNWTRDELLVALKIYCELEFGQFHQHQQRIVEVSTYIQRTPSSLAMKLCNFASLDPAMMGMRARRVNPRRCSINARFRSFSAKVMVFRANSTS